MAGNKVVARYLDGHTLKGVTTDFLPTREVFHVAPDGGGVPLAVRHHDLKAIFFVRDLVGDPGHSSRNEFDPAKPVIGKKLRVVFVDGEILIGTTQGYQPGRPGFFIVPASPDANSERCFVLTAATSDVGFI